MLRKMFNDAAGAEAAKIVAGLGDEVVEFCLLGAAFDMASRRLRTVLTNAHLHRKGPLGARVVLADEDDIKLVLTRMEYTP